MKLEIMNWNKCELEFVKKVEVDLNRIESLKKTSLLRLNRARSTHASKENISLIVDDYYEAIKELLVAYLLKNGFKSKNHQCLISYFAKMNPLLERESLLLSQMSFFRNRLEYYGEFVPVEFYSTRKEEFEHLVNVLLKLIK